ncbi:hypothetical protein DEO72_LG10g1007 [Vigna unguiculata]|uniref:Uncharacterized protein n=1 Tax=Vigna unguiculata TaxID=3917 RepID=A0A4D6NAH9_VIGUN|nr:hypothetical protein DEO72_LG10g1007 [Vigna unguiculata]
MTHSHTVFPASSPFLEAVRTPRFGCRGFQLACPGEPVSPRRGGQRLVQAFSRKWPPRRLAQFRASERLTQARRVSPKRERAEAPVPDSRTLA